MDDVAGSEESDELRRRRILLDGRAHEMGRTGRTKLEKLINFRFPVLYCSIQLLTFTSFKFWTEFVPVFSSHLQQRLHVREHARLLPPLPHLGSRDCRSLLLVSYNVLSI